MTLSQRGRSSINAARTEEVWLPMLKLDNGAWLGPEYLVGNTEDITHRGQVYTAFSLQLSQPSQTEDGDSVIQFEAQNVGRELMNLLRSAVGPIEAEVFFIIASQPNTVQLGPYTAELAVASYDAVRVTGTMAAYPVRQENWNMTRVTAADYPGLF